MDKTREEQHSGVSDRHGRAFTYVGNSSRYDGHFQNTLRIEKSMRYNALNGQNQNLPNKTVRAGVAISYTHLTQPTGTGGGLGWCLLYQPYTQMPWWDSIGAFCVAPPERN